MIRDDFAGRPIPLAIMQTAAEASIASRLREVFESTFDCQEVWDAEVSPSAGLSSGPEATGVIYDKPPMTASRR